mgnify:CR=1 FL=1
MIEELVKRYPVLESVKGQIEDAYKILETCYENGGKLLMEAARRIAIILLGS